MLLKVFCLYKVLGALLIDNHVLFVLIFFMHVNCIQYFLSQMMNNDRKNSYFLGSIYQ